MRVPRINGQDTPLIRSIVKDVEKRKNCAFELKKKLRSPKPRELHAQMTKTKDAKGGLPFLE